jgi:glucose/arabinose dehydrogenase
MRKFYFFIIVLAGALLVACTSSETEPGPATDSTDESLTAVPAQVTATMAATKTFLPVIEVNPTATQEPTPTLIPTEEPTSIPSPTPISPVSSIGLQVVIPDGLKKPTFLTHAFDDRLFVLEQVGRIRIIENNQLLEQPFLDITERVGSTSSEQGLLGLAFHPNYATAGAPGEGQFFVNYTDKSGHTHISRFSVMAGDPYSADPQSEVEYLFQEQPYPNHNGGSLAFGPDGYLYAGLGDGGSANDPLNAGQTLTTWLGKILRLNVDEAEDEYTIPPDNPFAGSTNALPEIWAYGLRNPWRFSFDRATGDFFIADVGQNQWEEVNFQPAGSPGGENYGWRIMEGTHCFQQDTCDQTGLVLPIFDYAHAVGGCSVTGGYVYRGALYPELAGNYFVADYCTGIIWRLFAEGERWLADVVLDSDHVISSFGEDVDGEIYVLNYSAGGVYQIIPGQ